MFDLQLISRMKKEDGGEGKRPFVPPRGTCSEYRVCIWISLKAFKDVKKYSLFFKYIDWVKEITKALKTIYFYMKSNNNLYIRIDFILFFPRHGNSLDRFDIFWPSRASPWINGVGKLHTLSFWWKIIFVQ